MARTGSDTADRRGDVSGFTLLETMLSIFLLGGAILTAISTLSRDMSAISRTRIDLIGQTALRTRVEWRRLRGYDAMPVPVATGPTCQEFTNDPDVTNDPDYAEFRALSFREGWECVEMFHDNNGNSDAPEANLRRLTVVTKVLDRAAAPNDPNIHQWRAIMLVARNGINRQPNE